MRKRLTVTNFIFSLAVLAAVVMTNAGCIMMSGQVA